MDTVSLLHLVIWIVIIGIIFYVLWWIVDYVGLPEPFNKVAKVIIALAAVVLLISKLLPLAGIRIGGWSAKTIRRH